jgi:hypothetical protein
LTTDWVTVILVGFCGKLAPMRLLAARNSEGHLAMDFPEQLRDRLHRFQCISRAWIVGRPLASMPKVDAADDANDAGGGSRMYWLGQVTMLTGLRWSGG